MVKKPNRKEPMHTQIVGIRLGGAIRSSMNTQKSLADLTGINPVQISRWVHGHSMPSVRNMAKMLIVMPEIDARWLMGADWG